MVVKSLQTGGRFEKAGSYSRAKRVGPFVFIAGTTAIEKTGKLHAPDDTYAQTIFVFNRIAEALHGVGADLAHVVRTRGFLTDLAKGGADYVRAHGEIFAGIEPVTSAVQVGLTMPGMMIEIEVDAVIHSPAGDIEYG